MRATTAAVTVLLPLSLFLLATKPPMAALSHVAITGDGGTSGSTSANQIPPSIDSPLERVEISLNLDFPGIIDHDFARAKVLDYLTVSNLKPGQGLVPSGNAKLAKCFPAPGKMICGTVDSRHNILAFSHYGCCLENTVMIYANAASLRLPTVDLSEIQTRHGITLGSNETDVSTALGTPRVFRGVRSGRTAYGYEYVSASRCPVYSIMFVFNREQRVEAIRDTFGC